MVRRQGALALALLVAPLAGALPATAQARR